MITKIGYSDRVIQLIDLGLSNGEVYKIIHEEYSIHLSSDQINTKRDRANQSHESVKDKITNDDTQNQDLASLILGVFESEDRALSAKEIAEILKRKSNLWIERKQISQALYSKDLKNMFYHDRSNWTYTLIEEKKTKASIRNSSIIEIDCNEDILNYYIDELLEDEVSIETGNVNFDSIVKLITRDNKITESEEQFILQKIVELDLDKSILSDIKKSIFEKNPFLDHVINLIFEDGIITDEELKFLCEKKDEHKFSKEFVNNRFWVVGIKRYSNYLIQYRQFTDLVKIWYLYEKALGRNLSIKSLIEEELDIFSSNNFIEIINLTYSRLYDKYKSLIEIKLDSDFDSLMNSIPIKIPDIEIVESKNSDNKSEKLNPIKIQNKSFFFEITPNALNPLFSFAFERSTGKHIVYINSQHGEFKRESLELISKIASSMYYSKLTMTDPNTSKYIRRIVNNLDLIEYE